jgi:putative membrane protein
MPRVHCLNTHLSTRIVSMGKTRSSSTRMIAPTAAALAAALAVGAAHAQTPQDSAAHRSWQIPGPKTSTNRTADTTRLAAMADSAFIREAGTGNMLEIRLSNLAQQKASNSAVKDFAKRMVSDHTSMWDQWSSLAKKNGLPVSSSLDAAHQQTVSQLGALSGADFDRAYLSAMVQNHQDAATTFQQLGPSAHSAEVRQLAATELPAIQQHLSLAQQVASQVGAPTSVATSPAPLPTPGGKVNPPQNDKGQNGKGGNNAKADGDYVTEVAYGHIMEVRLAQIAQQKATDPQVKQFADRMYDDFNKWMGRWSELASKNGANFNPNMGPKHQEKIERLQKAPREDFDKTYLDIVTENLNSMIPYFQKEGGDAQTGKVRNMVKDELPTLQQHLQVAERLDRTSQASAGGKSKNKSKSLSENKQ